MKRVVTVCLGLGLGFGIAEGEFIGGGVSIYFFLPILSVQGGG